MKIVFFLPSLENGGAERVVSLLANEMSKKNDIYILLLNDSHSDYYIEKNVKIVPFNCVVDREHGIIKKAFSIFANEIRRFMKYVQYINDINPDCIISMLFTTNILAVFSNLFLKKYLIVSERNDPKSYSGFKQLLITKFYKKAKYIVCQSDYVKNYFNCSNSVVIYNPVDTEFVVKSKQNNACFRIMTAGRLVEQKNQKMLINAVKRVIDDGFDCKLDIYGEGDLRTSLEKQIKAMNLEKKVFLRGFSNDIKKEMLTSDLFVLSSNFEGFPNVLIEAMSCCLPVISTKFPTGIASVLIAEDMNGFLIDVGDEDSLVMKIEKIISNPLDFLQLREIDYKMVSNFTAKKISAQWLNLIDYTIKM